MIPANQALKFLSSNVSGGNVWEIATKVATHGASVAKYAGSVLFSNWGSLNADNPREGTIKLLKIAGAAGLGLWSAATAVRNYEEGRAVIHNNGNGDGSAVWSYSQTMLQALSAGLSVTGLLLPNSPAGWIMKNIPVAAVAPAAIGLAMDHFQGLATCTSDHPLASLAQFGLSNYLIETKASENPGTVYRSTLLPWWSRNIRTLDEKVFAKFGVEFRRPHYFDIA